MATEIKLDKPEDVVWRFDDQGIMAGPYSYSELEEYVESGYIKETTEIAREDGKRFKAWELGLFGDIEIIEKNEAFQPSEERIVIENLAGWKIIRSILLFCWMIFILKKWLPQNTFFIGLQSFSHYLLGFSLIAFGIYAGVQGAIQEVSGWRQTLSYILGGIVVSFIGILFVVGKLGLL